jgi:methylphosphotriester-DNA--protein-cysteine methyltransferase
MSTLWLKNPYVNLTQVASRLYGSHSRLHTHRLRKKITSIQPFEPWEIQKLEQIKQDLLKQLKPETTT